MSIKDDFKSAIYRGTGEAHLLMMNYPEVNFSSEIIKASLKNLSYDNQSEGSRAEYIFELIKLAPQKEKIRKRILQGLIAEFEDTWALDQLYDLAMCFAQEDDSEAKNAIYKRYSMQFIEYSDWVGENAIIKLDGLSGLKTIAERKGEMFLKDKNAWEDSFLVDEFQSENPEIKVLEELEELARDNKNIASYLKMIKQNKFETYTGKSRKFNYEIVSENIRTNKIIPLPVPRAKDLSVSDILKLADDFKKSKLRIETEKYLRVFDLIKYPYDFNDLLIQAKRAYSYKDRLVEYAVNSLKHFKNPKIREFALERLNIHTNNVSDYCNLLISNYKNGDSEILCNLVDSTNNSHKIHQLTWSYVKIYEVNKTKDCLKPLMALYKKTNCGIHRKDIVEILKSNNLLSPKINEEIKFDSYLETRKLAI